MKRPWQVWLVFAVCVLGAAGAMAWLTREVVEADRLRRAARAEAEIEQRVSLAVWRMDTELAPILAAEVIRPASAFRPGSVAAELPPFVLLQFQILPNGVWQSPQLPATKSAPVAESQTRLHDLSLAVNYQQLLTALPNTPLPTAADLVRAQNSGSPDWNAANAPGYGLNVSPNLATANAPPPIDQQAASDNNQYQFVEGNRGANYSDNSRGNFSRSAAPNSDGQSQAMDVPGTNQQVRIAPQQSPKENDFQSRNKRIQSAAAQQSIYNTTQQQQLETLDVTQQQKPAMKGEVQKSVVVPEQVGVSRPVWIGDRLIMARRVERGGTTVVQGSWLDWPPLKARLLGEATGQFPQADLVPVNDDSADDPSRMLAGLPVRLVVNETVADSGVGPTLRGALWMGWGAVFIAVLAAAALLQGVMALSERRAAFVSSVTHELRTPLTTFRMYAEMLARGMVPDAERRQEYFETLQKESERLTLLVENVLAYARLERGRKPQAQDRVTVVDLLQRVRKRLEQRAAQAGMECIVELNPKTAEQEFTTDTAVVEQILFNLVDNAAKYARNAADRRIHVEANRNGQYVKLIVRDHGPGIGHEAAERTQAFEKSAQESAETAPGVGLGLALCRRLARQLGGRLDVAKANGEGAEVTLMLPMVISP
jgi:signal transduction histidine kinase